MFEHYPWTRHVIPEEGYGERLLALQELCPAHAHRHGFVAVTGNLDGVIALLPPDAPDPDVTAVEQIVALHGDRIGRLETSDLRNVTLYERHGFSVTGRRDHPDGPPVWATELHPRAH
ncbi:hypothetical protein [Dietzia sp. SYD-A1]|uniref:hypothetical protein n=1 Tax=Dietzia sp. SYD-A1 TaxID=2780141 RepID=UPI002815C6CE|nr:hypothetical protein [Dietzia sp. SYD-A1]